MTDIDELLTRMTLEEKCAQLGCMWFSGLLVDGDLALDRLALAAADGIGQVGRIAIEAGTGPSASLSWETASSAISSRRPGSESRR